MITYAESVSIGLHFLKMKLNKKVSAFSYGTFKINSAALSIYILLGNIKTNASGRNIGFIRGDKTPTIFIDFIFISRCNTRAGVSDSKFNFNGIFCVF